MHNLHHKLYVIEGFNGMLYVFSSHCYCHPVIYSLSLFIIYSVNSFIANVICYITIPSLNKVLYLVSYILYHSTDLCVLVYALTEFIEYFESRSTSVYVEFLDSSKAFDKINHWVLFKKLIARRVPIYLVKVLYYWYQNQSMYIKREVNNVK